MENVSFTEKDIVELSQLLLEREGGRIECEKEISGIWLHSPGFETELRLHTLKNMWLTVSRVCFMKRRQGTMTAVSEWLKTFCAAHSIPEIVIQCVQTPEMAAWCQKNGFVPDPIASFPYNGGFIAGDYRLELGNQYPQKVMKE